MSPSTPLGALAAGTAAAALCAAAAYWWARFRLLLPLDRALFLERERALGLGAFARELLSDPGEPETPQLLAGALQSGGEELGRRFENLHLCLWYRMGLGGAFSNERAELALRTGFLAALEPVDLEFPVEVWERAAREGTVLWKEDLPEALRERLAACGLRALRLSAWGTPGRVWGLLGAFDADPAASSLGEGAGALDILTAHCGALAERAARSWEQRHARERLEGGLHLTMRRLDETNLQLIQKTRELRTVQEVTEAISEHPDQPDVLGAIASTVAKALEADVCAFLLLDDTAGDLVTQPGAFGLEDDEGSLYRISLKNEMASSVRVFRSGQAFMTGDAQNDPRVLARYARLWRCHSLAVVPLKIEARRIGVMRVGSFRKNFFNESHLQFVRVIAEEAAVLIESAMMTKRLAEMNRQLAHLHRLKDDFVSTVSHEFKTPLTTITGFLSVVLDEEAGPLSKDQRRFLTSCKAASERLRLLVSGLLDISKLEGGLRMEFASVALDDLARLAVENHLWDAEKGGVSVILEAPKRLPPVHGDEKWLAQVLDNLLSNAVKFTPRGGKVELALENKGECVEVRVCDSGIGIPEEDRERIFEKFYRGKNREKLRTPGTGLGLAICRSIIDKHEGRIWFESEAGKGTRFFFQVPVSKVALQERPDKLKSEGRPSEGENT
ncbi:MAG: GAF domain-containing sensor histidine kinase [Elusimicrobiota bacterium]